MLAEPGRVLMAADAVGGVWTYALELAGALAPAGIEFVIATMGPLPSGPQHAAAAALPNVELVTSEFKLEWMDDPWSDVECAGNWLLDLEARTAPDLVHLNGYAHGLLPFRAPVLVAGHSCVLSWADAVPGEIDASKLSAYAEHVAPGIRCADLVVAPSQTMLAALQRHYGPLSPARVVYNGRRSEPFQPSRKEPFIFTAGRLWDRAKNIHALSRIAARLPWPTAVAGAEAFAAEGARIVPAGMRALGPLDERALAGWLGRASIFALPARYEPFGLLPLEAALAGCALVLGDIPSLREVWGEAALFVAPDDIEALAGAIGSLIASPRELLERADAAHARAARYSIEAMAAGYREAYAVAMTAAADGVVSCES
jgi:glycogen synthase